MGDDGSKAAISLDDYKAELRRLSVNFAAIYDEPLIIPKKDRVVAHHWHWADLERILHQSLQFQDKLPTNLAGAERRIVRLQNPGLDGETVTNTMSMSVQLLLPGELARPHRHTPVAFRFFLKGQSYTTVNGEKHQMEPGDLVLTPYMQWHDHGNDGDEPGIWIDGLDFPLVRFLDAVIKQDTDEPQQDTQHSSTSDRRFSATGLRPTWIDADETERASLIHYRWAKTEAALNAMAEADDASATDDVMLEYVNPATGASGLYDHRLLHTDDQARHSHDRAARNCPQGLSRVPRQRAHDRRRSGDRVVARRLLRRSLAGLARACQRHRRTGNSVFATGWTDTEAPWTLPTRGAQSTVIFCQETP